MSDNVRWEPVTSHDIADREVHPWADLEYHDNEAGRYFVATGLGEFALEDGYALCRATKGAEAPPAATWSQDVPTEAGNYWLWYDFDDMPQNIPFAVSLDHLRGKAIFIMPDGNHIAASEFPAGVWYMPATVPQPPSSGEAAE